MGRMTDNMKQLADDAERAVKAMHSAPKGGGFGPSSPAGGVTFVTNIATPPGQGRTIRTGDGSGTGGRDIQSRAFAYFGLSSANASAAFIAQIVKAFEDMLAKGALSVRTMGGG